jgi:hypothetical protein
MRQREALVRILLTAPTMVIGLIASVVLVLGLALAPATGYRTPDPPSAADEAAILERFRAHGQTQTEGLVASGESERLTLDATYYPVYGIVDSSWQFLPWFDLAEALHPKAWMALVRRDGLPLAALNIYPHNETWYVQAVHSDMAEAVAGLGPADKLVWVPPPGDYFILNGDQVRPIEDTWLSTRGPMSVTEFEALLTSEWQERSLRLPSSLPTDPRDLVEALVIILYYVVFLSLGVVFMFFPERPLRIVVFLLWLLAIWQIRRLRREARDAPVDSQQAAS